MEEERRQRIIKLAEEAYEAEERYKNLSIMNVPQNPEDRKKAKVEFALAQAEFFEANKKLNDAIQKTDAEM